MITENLINLVSHYESLHDGDLSVVGLQPKMCPAEYWTEGYGSVVLDSTGTMLRYAKNKHKAYANSKIKTIEQAKKALQIDMEKYQTQVKVLVGQIEQNKLDALTSFAYNCGIEALKKSTLLKKVKAKASDKEIEIEFLKWNKGGGRVLKGLTYRRQSEFYLFQTGLIKFYN